MEVVENNLAVVSPIADKLFFVHIDPGGGLKGVKVTDTFAFTPEASDRFIRKLIAPGVVVYDKKRFGDPEGSEDTNNGQEPEEDGYLRVVIHCFVGGTRAKDGSMNQALNLYEGDTPANGNPPMANPTFRLPVSIRKKDGRLVAHTDRAEILCDSCRENAGLFKSKTITAAGVIGLKRSVRIGKVKVEVDRDRDSCLVISDPDAPPPE